MASYQRKKKAFILGFSGAIGNELLKHLAKGSYFSKVVLIGRRKIEFDDPIMKNWEQRIVDFENLSKHINDLKNFDIGFCSFGATASKVDNETFYKVRKKYLYENCIHFLSFPVK